MEETHDRECQHVSFLLAFTGLFIKDCKNALYIGNCPEIINKEAHQKRTKKTESSYKIHVETEHICAGNCNEPDGNFYLMQVNKLKVSLVFITEKGYFKKKTLHHMNGFHKCHHVPGLIQICVPNSLEYRMWRKQRFSLSKNIHSFLRWAKLFITFGGEAMGLLFPSKKDALVILTQWLPCWATWTKANWGGGDSPPFLCPTELNLCYGSFYQ